ncbi:MAG: rhomboid family intramembrane serine protease [Thermoanaerobaculia bacterium]
MAGSSSRAVVCPECGRLVAASEPVCPFCGASRPAGGGVDGLLRALFGLPFEYVVIAVCATLYLLSLALDPSAIAVRGGLFGVLAPSPRSLLALGGSGALPVFGLGRWWTVLSATWLHGGLIHVLFNMLWVRQLAPAVAGAYGAARTALIFVGSGVCGFLLSSFMGAWFGGLPSFLRGATLTIGASASIFGLLGAVVYFGRRHGFGAAARQAWTWALVLFVMGLLMPGVDNYAHLGGFLGGYLGARLLAPTRPESRTDRLAAALALFASLAAVLWSFFDTATLAGL